MKVQACTSCGARYNVERLEQGAVFACRRCQADVTVGEQSRERRGIAIGLLLAGFLMLGCTFLYANPHSGFAAQRWPWEQFRDTPSLILKATYVLWTATALWALVTALIPAWRWRSVITLACGGYLLLLATTAPEVGFTIHDHLPLPWMLGVIALAAGLDLSSFGRGGTVTRALALIGGIGLIWYYAKSFPVGEPGSHLQILTGDLVRLVQGELEGVRPTYYALLGSSWCILLASAMGILVGLGLKKRLFSLIGFLLVVIGLLVPSFVTLGEELSDGVTMSAATSILMNRAAVALVGQGVALWMLTTYAVSDLVKSREAAA